MAVDGAGVHRIAVLPAAFADLHLTDSPVELGVSLLCDGRVLAVVVAQPRGASRQRRRDCSRTSGPSRRAMPVVPRVSVWLQSPPGAGARRTCEVPMALPSRLTT